MQKRLKISFISIIILTIFMDLQWIYFKQLTTTMLVISFYTNKSCNVQLGRFLPGPTSHRSNVMGIL